MTLQIYEIKGNIEKDALNIIGYHEHTKRYFQIYINTVDMSYGNTNEQCILVKQDNKLYCIETTLMTTIPASKKKYHIKNFNYIKYNIPETVYMSMIGSIVTNL